MHTRNAEKGQALILIILAMVGMFAFAALAVDGGRLYAERRRAQSAADAAALSVAFAVTQQTPIDDAIAGGLDLAATNGFDDNGITNNVTINWPPVSGPYTGNTEYYQVTVWQKVDPVFSHLIFSGDEGVTVEAVARAVGIDSVSGGQAMHSLSTDTDSMVFDGTVAVEVIGGNIYSNGGMTKNGTGNNRIEAKSGGAIFAHGSWTPNGHPVILPTPQEGAAVVNAQTVPTPSCLETVDETTPASETFTHPDGSTVKFYYHKTELSGTATLQPGFHCFYNGIRLTGQDKVTGTGVVMIMMQGGISMTGQSKMTVKRPNDIVDKNGAHWGGLLMYAPPTNTNTFKLGGTSDSVFTGTVLIPGGTCTIGGTESTNGLHMALICNKVRTHGNPKVKIIYRPEENFRMSPLVELVQ